MEEEKIIFQVDTQQATTSLKSLKAELKSAKDAMLNAQEGTDEYNAALKRAAQAQFTMKEMNEQIKGSAMDVGEVLSNTTNVLGGVAGGINAVNAVTALMGVENENLQKTFVKLQASMAVVQGLQGIDGMIKGFKNLSIVMSQSAAGIKILTAVQKVWNYITSINPIFLLVTVLASVVTGIGLLTKALKSNNEEEKKANINLEKQLQLIQDINTNNDYRIRMMKASGASDKEIAAEQVKASQDRLLQLRGEIDLIEKNNKKFSDYEKIKKKWGMGATDARKKILPELKKSLDEEIELYKKNLENKQIVDIQDNTETKKKLEDNYKAIVDNNTKINAEINRNSEKTISDAQKWNDEFATARFENNQAELDSLMASNEEWLNGYNEWLLNRGERQLESDKRFAELQYQALVDKHNAFDDLDRIAFANGAITGYEYQMSTLENQIAFNEEILNNTKLTEEEKTRIEAENAEARRAIRELELQGVMDAVFSTGKLLGQASNLLGKKTAEGKAMSIISTTIGALESATGAYNSLIKTPFVGPTIAPIAAGVAFAAGMKNVKAISAVKVPKSSDAGGNVPSVSAPSVSTSAPVITNAIQATRNVNTPAEIELQNQPIKAYVVETDISSTQSRVNNIRNEATF